MNPEPKDNEMDATKTETLQEVATRIGKAIARDAVAQAREDGRPVAEWTGLDAQDADQIPAQFRDRLDEISEFARTAYVTAVKLCLPLTPNMETRPMNETITLRSHNEEITIPGSRSPVKREYSSPTTGPADTALHAQVMIAHPVGVTILLRSDGSWTHWDTDFRSDNHYLHFSNLSDHRDVLTEAKRRTLARWWLGIERPYGLTIGGPVCEWAFKGLTADEISARYGDGRKVYLTAPCDENERIVARPQTDTDDSWKREAYLEQAVEEGQISGAN